MFLIKLGFRPWRATFFTQTLAVLSSALLMTCGMGLWGFSFALDQVIQRIERENVLTVFLEPGLTETHRGQVLDQIKVAVGAAPVTLEVSKSTEFLDRLKKTDPTLVQELLALGPEGDSLIPEFVSLSGAFPGGTSQVQSLSLNLRAITGVENVDSTGERFSHLAKNFSILQKIIFSLMVGIGIALGFLYFVMGRLNRLLLQDSLDVLRFWGASSLSLQIPALLSALLTSFLGGLVAAVFARLMGGFWMGHFQNISPLLNGIELQVPFSVFLLPFFALLVAVPMTALSTTGSRGVQ